jgi:pimeloyl-ACP methyl ester carboxylesterase
MALTVHNVHVHLWDQGTGIPTLFLHGNPDTADLWSGVIAELQTRFRCIAPDLPGFGRSTAPADFDCSLTHWAQFIDDLLAALRITEPINLVVHDLGGNIGLAWAATYPAKVRRLAISNTWFFADYRWHFWARVWRTPVLGELSTRLNNWWLFRHELRRGSPRLTTDHLRRTYAHVTPSMLRMVLRSYRALDPAHMGAWEGRLLALTAQTPTCVLWGRRDPYIPDRFAERFGAQEVVYFPENGHWLPAEAPASVAHKLQLFLA